MLQSVRLFLLNKLEVPAADISPDQIEDIRRQRLAKNSKVKLEVMVVFKNVDTRDFIASHSRNLAGFQDASGNPTATVRMEVPMHLRGVKKELEEYGYLLKYETGMQKDFKRSIKFNDAEQTLYMDVLYPGEKRWAKITYEQARDGNKQNNLEMAAKSRSKGNSGAMMEYLPPNQARSGPAATPQPPIQASQSQDVWTFHR